MLIYFDWRNRQWNVVSRRIFDKAKYETGRRIQHEYRPRSRKMCVIKKTVFSKKKKKINKRQMTTRSIIILLISRFENVFQSFRFCHCFIFVR